MALPVYVPSPYLKGGKPRGFHRKVKEDKIKANKSRKLDE